MEGTVLPVDTLTTLPFAIWMTAEPVFKTKLVPVVILIFVFVFKDTSVNLPARVYPSAPLEAELESFFDCFFPFGQDRVRIVAVYVAF